MGVTIQPSRRLIAAISSTLAISTRCAVADTNNGSMLEQIIHSTTQQMQQLKVQRLFKPVIPGYPIRFSNPPPITAKSLGEDLLVLTEAPYKGAQGELLRNHNGKPRFLRIQHRIYRQAETL